MFKRSKKKQGGDANGRLVAALATTGAVYLARKFITAAWTRATGKAPPTDPADPQVGLGEALGWAVVAGVTIEATRLFTARATTHRPRAADDPAGTEGTATGSG